MKWKVHVAGYKNWKIVPLRPNSYLGEVRGEPIEEDIIVEADDLFEAAEIAEEEFTKKGYYFDEVAWAEPVKDSEGASP